MAVDVVVVVVVCLLAVAARAINLISMQSYSLILMPSYVGHDQDAAADGDVHHHHQQRENQNSSVCVTGGACCLLLVECCCCWHPPPPLHFAPPPLVCRHFTFFVPQMMIDVRVACRCRCGQTWHVEHFAFSVCQHLNWPNANGLQAPTPATADDRPCQKLLR